MTLKLCEEHQQESNHSHFATGNCDHCKLRKVLDDVQQGDQFDPIEIERLQEECREILKVPDNRVPVRYFIEHYDIIIETFKHVYDGYEGTTTTHRDTMFENGVNQVCHTKVVSS